MHVRTVFITPQRFKTEFQNSFNSFYLLPCLHKTDRVKNKIFFSWLRKRNVLIRGWQECRIYFEKALAVFTNQGSSGVLKKVNANFYERHVTSPGMSRDWVSNRIKAKHSTCLSEWNISHFLFSQKTSFLTYLSCNLSLP